MKGYVIHFCEVEYELLESAIYEMIVYIKGDCIMYFMRNLWKIPHALSLMLY
jgi:hypothetical protein